MQAGKPKKILKSAQVKLRFNVPQALAWAAATYGKGRYRQLWEIAVAAFGRQKLTPKD